MKPQLSIIIVNWNGEKFLPDCLRSIAENPPSVPFEVIVIDNASTDGSPEWLASEAAREIFADGVFTFIQSKENLGFGKANNLVIAQTETPYVFLLNPDTIVKPFSIDRLMEKFLDDREIGMVVPKILDQNEIAQPSVWAIPTVAKLIVDGFGFYYFLPKKMRGNWLLFKHWSYDQQRNVPLASGCAMMVSREVINEVGVFNPEIFMYGEDIEWCYRIGSSGYKIRFNPESEIVHIGGQSSKARWSTIETRLKEEESWIGFQKRCLAKSSVTMNSLARIVTLYPRLVLQKIRRRDTTFLTELLSLQYSVVKSFFTLKSNPR